jgi:hypothetical protein
MRMLNKCNLLAATSVLFLACGGQVTGGVAGHTIGVSISPAAVSVPAGGTQTFTATVYGASNIAVTWSVTEAAAGGTIDTSGTYVAPPSTGTYHVVATSQADSSKSATAVVTVTVPLPAAPSNLVATATSSSGITLTWSNNATNQTGFLIRRSTTSGTTGFTQVATPSASSTSYSDSGLTASTEYWYEIAATNSSGNSVFSNVATATTPASGSGAVSRPSYNTGVGFFTLNGKLYDANGNEFHIEGVNALHYDENWASCSSNCGIPNSRANVSRIVTPLWPSISATTLSNLMQLMISSKIVPMPGVWYIDSGYTTQLTCDNNISHFNTAVSQWVSRASLFKPFERYMLINIANEYGDANSTVWRDTYISAVATLRAAGYLNTLVVDAGGCGQDPADIIKYAQAIYDADPQRNILFDLHIYGGFYVGTPAWTGQIEFYSTMASLKATGLPIVIGEFGPGNNIGPSPTMITPDQIIQAANSNDFGWIAWAWDDGYGSGNSWFELSNAGAFSLTNGAPTNGAYPNNTDLSAYGNEVVLNPALGTFATAKPATIFP